MEAEPMQRNEQDIDYIDISEGEDLENVQNNSRTGSVDYETMNQVDLDPGQLQEETMGAAAAQTEPMQRNEEHTEISKRPQTICDNSKLRCINHETTIQVELVF